MKGRLSRAVPSYLHVVLAITPLTNPAMEPFMRGVTLYFSGRQAGTSSGGLAIQAAAPPDEARSFRPPRSKFGGKVVEGGFSSPKLSMVGRQVKINPGLAIAG